MYIYSKSMILDILAKSLMVILWLSYGYPMVRYAELMLIVYWHPRPLYDGMMNDGLSRSLCELNDGMMKMNIALK